jgi:chromosome segregation ATPase
MINFVEQLRADAEDVACHGGDKVAIAKCINQAADRIEELERRCNESPDVILQRFMAEELRRKELEAKMDRLQTRLNHREGVMRDMQKTIGKQQDEYEKLEARYTKLGDEE